MDEQQGSTIQHRELYSMSYDNYIQCSILCVYTHTVFLNILFHYVCIAEPLYYMAIINKTLQINYNFKK